MKDKLKLIIKEILSESEINEITGIYDSEIYWSLEYKNIIRKINKYEFMFLCKEFMKEQNLCVWSGNGYNKSIGYECSITHFMFGDVVTFKADTEFEAIIDATYAVITKTVDFN